LSVFVLNLRLWVKTENWFIETPGLRYNFLAKKVSNEVMGDALNRIMIANIKEAIRCLSLSATTYLGTNDNMRA